MERTSIKKNISYQIVYEVLVILLPFITSPYVSRVLGAENIGEYSYSYSVAYFFVMISMLGIKNYGNREIARVRDDKCKLSEVFVNLYAVHFIVSVLCCIGYFFYIVYLRSEAKYALIQGAFVLSALFDISWFYFGIEKFKLTVTRDTIVKLCTVLCIFLFVHKTDDIWKYCSIMAFGMLASQMSLWVPLKKYIGFQRPCWTRMKIHMKPLIVLFIPAFSISLYKYMDKIMIGAYSNKVELGYYENAEKAINIPLSVISAFGTVMLPKMSNLAVTQNKGETEKYMKLSMLYVMAVGFLLAFGIAGVGRGFAPVFWGKEFAECGNLIIGLACTIPFISFANIIRTQYLIPNQKDKEYVVSVITGAVVNLVINKMLIAQMGAYGAMIGTIAAEIVVCLVQGIAVCRKLPLVNYIKNFIPFLLVGLMMFCLIFHMGEVLDKNVFTLLLQGAVGGVFYILCGCGILYKKRNEMFLDSIKKLKYKLKGFYKK